MKPTLLRPCLKGDRFSEHSLPLEVLKDFAALGELLIDIAKTEYRNDNPSRQRIPKGFSQNLELHLTGIERGSVMLDLSLPIIAAAGVLSQQETNEFQYIERAWNKVGETIAASAEGKPLPLDINHLRYFDRFGRSLRDGETIEFPFADGKTAPFTPKIRENILVASQAQEWTEEVVLKGRIPEVDQKDLTFELEIRGSGLRLQADLEEQHRHIILDAFNDYRNGKGQTVAINGIVKRSRSGNYKSIESITEITLLDPLDIETQLEDFIELKDGWFDGRGKAFNPDDLKKLAKDFEQYYDADLPLPYLYSLPDGEVEAEWDIGRNAVSIEIELPSKKSYYHNVNLDTQSDDEADLYLSEVSGWTALNDKLRTLVREAGGIQ